MFCDKAIEQQERDHVRTISRPGFEADVFDMPLHRARAIESRIATSFADSPSVTRLTISRSRLVSEGLVFPTTILNCPQSNH